MNRLRTTFTAAGAFLSRWQEFIVWLPGLVMLTLIGFVVLGAFTSLGGDSIAWLAELPVLCAYAAAALAFAWLFKRTNLHDLTDDQEAELHRKAAAGDKDAQWVLKKDRLEWLVLLVVLCAFFWPAR
jgi:hypothetical protein